MSTTHPREQLDYLLVKHLLRALRRRPAGPYQVSSPGFGTYLSYFMAQRRGAIIREWRVHLFLTGQVLAVTVSPTLSEHEVLYRRQFDLQHPDSMTELETWLDARLLELCR